MHLALALPQCVSIELRAVETVLLLALINSQLVSGLPATAPLQQLFVPGLNQLAVKHNEDAGSTADAAPAEGLSAVDIDPVTALFNASSAPGTAAAGSQASSAVCQSLTFLDIFASPAAACCPAEISTLSTANGEHSILTQPAPPLAC